MTDSVPYFLNYAASHDGATTANLASVQCFFALAHWFCSVLSVACPDG